MTNTSWPPSCRSAASTCTCCCILTPHTHLSDAAGYPHLNHIIRFPQPEQQGDQLAWFHCPHCPCTLGITWIHPNEMAMVEENVAQAPWLPRLADFEGYSQFEDCSTPMSSSSAGENSITQSSQSVLGEKMNGMNVPAPGNAPMDATPELKTSVEKTRRSFRKPRQSRNSVNLEDPDYVPYKPRKSKYDIN